MAKISTTVVAAMLIFSALIMAQGFGEQFEVFQESQQFQTSYPNSTTCNWNEAGTLVNLVQKDECELHIDDTTSTYTNVNLNRLPEKETENELKTGSRTTNGIEFSNNSLGAYFTPTGNKAQYYSKYFYLKPADLQLEYQYEEISQPQTAELILWDAGNNNVEDSVTLQPGTENNDYLETATLTSSNQGNYQLRIEIDNGAKEEQKVYSLYAYQNSEDLTGISAGRYESDIIYESDARIIESVNFLGDNIQNGLKQKKQTATLTLQGIRYGQIIEEKSYETENSLRVLENPFEDSEITSFRFQIEFVSETGVTPEFSSIDVKGIKADRIASQSISDDFQILIVVILVGIALAYGVREFYG